MIVLKNGASVRIEIVDVSDLDEAMIARMIAVTEAVFPQEESLRGKYFFDTPPALVALALCDDRLVGLRPVNRRTIQIAGRPVALAGGIIPAILPDFRQQGIATMMVERLLEHLARLDDDYSLAFLFDDAPETFLEPFEYRWLDIIFCYEDRYTGEDIIENARPYGRSLGGADIDKLFASAERVHLGRGVW